jgi:type I restriction enzyme S subunit
MDATPSNVAMPDDILFAWSGSLGIYRWSGEESLINQHIFKVIPNEVPPWFVWLWIAEHLPSFKAIAADKATTMGHIQRRHLGEARVAVPPTEMLDEADAVIGPVDQHRASLVQEQRTLAQIRDVLLPKLISGEIRVPDTADPAEVIEPLAEEFATS